MFVALQFPVGYICFNEVYTREREMDYIREPMTK